MSKVNSDDGKQQTEQSLPKKDSARFLKRYILPSDNHSFVGRVYDLGIVSLNFDTYEALAQYPDCKYAYDTGDYVKVMAQRVESLNLAGDLLWPEPIPDNFGRFPVSRYDWLNIAADVFLMRYISVVDCAIILTNAVFQFGLEAKKCSIANLQKAGLPPEVLDILQKIQDDQGTLRSERNARFHHGHERFFTRDDLVFKTASIFEHRGSGITGNDRHGRKINVARSFKEGLVGLQRDFNRSTRQLVKHLDTLYDLLGDEFEDRFAPLIAAATHGLNANSRNRSQR